jgi:hypothetical protein
MRRGRPAVGGGQVMGRGGGARQCGPRDGDGGVEG